MFRRLIVSATVKREDGDVTYFSTLHGRWADDSESLWTNDDNLTQKCLELPLDLPNSEPVDVRIYFAWYSGSGFVYIDPAVTLAALKSNDTIESLLARVSEPTPVAAA